MDILSIIALFMSFAVLNVDTVSSFPPPLPKKKEQELFLLARDGDESAREELIEHNLRLVAHIVRKYYSHGEDAEDLISVGAIGLIKAVDSFDISKGAGFATYGARCVQNEILMFFRARKKHQSDVSINDTIDIDKDGNPVQPESKAERGFEFRPVGSGIQDVKAIMEASEKAGAEYVIVEQDEWYDNDSLECAAKSRAYLKSIGY